MPGQIDGLAELRRDVRRSSKEVDRVIRKELKKGADEVTARARALVAKGTGEMAASLRPFVKARSAGVRSDHPGAGVEEFAKSYRRRNRTGDGSNRVTIGDEAGAPPRFAYKAIDQLGPALIERTFGGIVTVLKLNGWFREER